jgi:hypothetical protein
MPIEVAASTLMENAVLSHRKSIVYEGMATAKVTYFVAPIISIINHNF